MHATNLYATKIWSIRRRKRTKVLVVVAVAGLFAAACGQSASTDEATDDFPNRAIDLVIGDSPGGGFDAMARRLAPILSDELGVQVRPTNNTGVNYIDFLDQVYGAESDGYTVGFMPSEMFTMHFLRPDLYERDLEDLEVALAIEAPPNFVAASSQAPFDDAEELLAFEGSVRGNSFTGLVPGMISLAIAAEVNDLGFETQPVVSPDWSAGHLATVRGDVDLTFNAASGGPLTSVEKGEYVPLFLWGSESVEGLEDIPTSNELGLPEELGATQLTRPVIAPPETPEENLEIIKDAFARALEHPDMVDWAEESRQTLSWLNADEFWDAQHELIGIYQEHDDIVEGLIR